MHMKDYSLLRVVRCMILYFLVHVKDSLTQSWVRKLTIYCKYAFLCLAWRFLHVPLPLNESWLYVYETWLFSVAQVPFFSLVVKLAALGNTGRELECGPVSKPQRESNREPYLILTHVFSKKYTVWWLLMYFIILWVTCVSYVYVYYTQLAS